MDTETGSQEGGIMGKGQPSVSGQAESSHDGSQGIVQGVGSPQEIESVTSRAGVSNRNVYSELEMKSGTSISTEVVRNVGPSYTRGESSGELAVRIGDADSNRLNESSGAERAGTEQDLGCDLCQKEDDPHTLGIEGGAGTTAEKQYRASDKSRDSHVLDIPITERAKVEELDSYKAFPMVRTTSNFSVESSSGDQCRICQQHTEEPLMELGCHCRGELANAHRTCVDHWFGNKGTNKCEVCQHVATNVPLPSSQPTPHFWVWRVGGGPYNGAATRRAGGVGPIRLNPLPMRPVLLMTLRRHPTIMLLWLLLFAFMAYLFVDVTDKASIGYAAMPIGFLFGVLVVLGLGTAARLVLECWHERVIRRNIRRMEEEPNFEDFPAEQTNININVDPVEGQQSLSVPPQTATLQGAEGASQVPTTASNT